MSTTASAKATTAAKKARTMKTTRAAVPSSLIAKPYSEYTIFFRLERAHILESDGVIDDEVLGALDPDHKDPTEFPRPARYASLVLPPYWYSAEHKAALEKRRKHRKREGSSRMDFPTLSKTVSERWKKADADVVAYCKRLARAEADKYERKVAELELKKEVMARKMKKLPTQKRCHEDDEEEDYDEDDVETTKKEHEKKKTKKPSSSARRSRRAPNEAAPSNNHSASSRGGDAALREDLSRALRQVQASLSSAEGNRDEALFSKMLDLQRLLRSATERSLMGTSSSSYNGHATSADGALAYPGPYENAFRGAFDNSARPAERMNHDALYQGGNGASHPLGSAVSPDRDHPSLPSHGTGDYGNHMNNSFSWGMPTSPPATTRYSGALASSANNELLRMPFQRSNSSSTNNEQLRMPFQRSNSSSYSRGAPTLGSPGGVEPRFLPLGEEGASSNGRNDDTGYKGRAGIRMEW